MALAEAALLGGSLLGGVGSLAGGLLGQQGFSSGDQILPSSDPRNFLNLQASNFDAANQLGFGDINSIPNPISQKIDQINSLSVDEKIKRRGLSSLRQIMNGEEPTYPRELDGVLIRIGMRRDDLSDLFLRDRQFNEARARLGDLNGINETTIRNRADAAQSASSLIADAARGATTGTLSEFQNSILGRINRSIDDSEERALLQGRLGGFNPAVSLEGISDMRADAELRAIEQSLLAAGNITNSLNAGLQAAQGSAQIDTNAQLSALQIAANQANAANQIQAQIGANNATSMANGVSGAINSFGQGLTTLGAINLLNRPNPADTGSTAPASGRSVFAPASGFNVNSPGTTGFDFRTSSAY